MVYVDIVDVAVATARLLQREIAKRGWAKPSAAKTSIPNEKDLAALYDFLVSSQPLRSATRKLFLDGHYARAVEEGYKCLNNTVKAKSGLSKDGNDLMNQAFSVGNPILKLNPLRTDSQKNEQVGYMLILAGCMTGIRNPRAHEHQLWDSPTVALEMLTWANHLMTVVGRAIRARKRKKSPKS